jgi:multisubunit Na+/H+ antiporter MnhF subunit
MSAWRRRVDERRIQLGALALLLAATAVLVYHETRGTSFLFDEWSWILNRRGGSAATYLDPHNQHLSLIPVAIYKLLFATFGIGSYVPYRVVMILCDLLLLGLLFAYARPRVGGWAALGVTAVLAVLGPGWEDFLWPFQIGFVLSLCGGVGALLALEARPRRANAVAAVLTLASLASSGVGIPVALGIAVEVAMQVWRARRPVQDAWIVAFPFGLFLAWWIAYQTGGSGITAVASAPSFVAKEAASVVASLFGRAGSTGLDGRGTLTSWGTPLLIASLAVVVWRVVRGGKVPLRVAALTTMLVTFWLATALTRGFFGNPFASRYIYVGALFALLLGMELARGWKPGPIWRVALAAVTGIAIGSNIGELRMAGQLVRGFGDATTADLGALEIARPIVPAGYLARGIPGYPLLAVPAHRFFMAADALGNPAASVAAIESRDEGAREVVDRELAAVHRVAPVPAPDGGSAARGCVRFGPRGSATLVISGGSPGLLIRAGRSPVTLSVRRFADAFQPVAPVPASAAARVRIAADLSTVPWHVRVTSAGPASACGL